MVDITSSKKTTIKHAHRMIEKILLTGVFIEPRTLGSALAFPYKMHQPKIGKVGKVGQRKFGKHESGLELAGT